MEHHNGCLPLTIGGKPRRLYFDYTFAGILFSIVPMEHFDTVLAQTPYRILPLVTYAALKAGDDVNELPDGFSEREASRWLMSVSPADSEQITALFRHSMGFIIQSYQVKQPEAQPEKRPKLKASL